VRRLLAFAGVSFLGLVAALVVVPPAAAAATCAGHRVTIQRGDGNNTIDGTSHADVIDAGAGDDVVNGRGGNDIICGGEGSDDLRGNAGNDRLYGGLDRVREEKFFSDMCVTMTPTGYCLLVDYFGDVLRGNTGNDLLVPGYDNRTFNTTVVGEGRIRDQLRWDTAPRAVTVNLTKGTATGDGSDGITAAGLVRAVTSPYADTVVGTTVGDEIQTGSGANTVFARDGDDHYFGGSGPDTYNGGPGSDEYDSDLGGNDTCNSVEVDPSTFCNSSTP
jgi:Ca2+-binding RTX toxin-like protein